jgi:hypothetical protein
MLAALLLAIALLAFAESDAGVHTCSSSASSCPSSPSNCSTLVTRALKEARFLRGHASTGTSPQQPAVVIPVTQLPHIPNVRFRMTLSREGGGGVVQWWLEWTQPYAVEVSNSTLASGHVVIAGLDVNWQGGGCTSDDMNVMRGLVVGAMAQLCARMRSTADDNQEGNFEYSLCFQETGIADMLQLHPPSLAQRQSYEFFLFFHFVVRPFCRVTPSEACWGSNDNLGAFESLQQHKLYEFTLFLELNINSCQESACMRVAQHVEDIAFYAVFHTAPGDSSYHPFPVATNIGSPVRSAM